MNWTVSCEIELCGLNLIWNRRFVQNANKKKISFFMTFDPNNSNWFQRWTMISIVLTSFRSKLREHTYTFKLLSLFCEAHACTKRLFRVNYSFTVFFLILLQHTSYRITHSTLCIIFNSLRFYVSHVFL